MRFRLVSGFSSTLTMEPSLLVRICELIPQVHTGHNFIKRIINVFGDSSMELNKIYTTLLSMIFSNK
jgi:hypothetical protein